MRKLFLILPLLAAMLLLSCSDNESFTTSPSNRLTFSVDTVMLDTVFSRVPSSTRTFWVFNHSGDGIRCSNVRLQQGNQTGFRVNVDGIYLGATEGYQTSDIELRNKDSLRVFVELTSPMNNHTDPQLLEDNLVFTLESGAEQKVNLRAFTWDAEMVDHLVVSRDTTISTTRPLVVSRGIEVAENATLQLLGTTLYFRANAGVDVYGRLITDEHDGRETVLRGDRLDHMFDYLPYDRVSGQWQGITFHDSSFENVIRHTELHSGSNGIVCDSSSTARSKLTMEYSTIHNMQGYGLKATNCRLSINTCQITNTLMDCLCVRGGMVDVNNCTLAQFYPFDSNRGAAIRFANSTGDNSPCPLERLQVSNTIITGYADDVLMGELGDSAVVAEYAFDHCLIRTPKVETADSVRFKATIWEDVKDTITAGDKNFALVDTDNLIYDFSLAKTSKAIGAALPAQSMPIDRQGRRRDDQPDMGCFEFEEAKTEN
jgi:hypothetical protein